MTLRQTAPQQLVLATGNLGKVAELQQAFANFQVEVLPQSHFQVTDVAETGLSFIENALIKARHASAATGLPALADDSGLAVQALQGAPGIYSARYAGEKASDQDNYEKLLAALAQTPQEQRQAAFYCVLAYVRHAEDPTPIIAQGIWQGEIAFAAQGTQGFGYDPVFYVPHYQCTAAELSLNDKNQASHRGQAIRQLLAQFKEA